MQQAESLAIKASKESRLQETMVEKALQEGRLRMQQNELREMKTGYATASKSVIDADAGECKAIQADGARTWYRSAQEKRENQAKQQRNAKEAADRIEEADRAADFAGHQERERKKQEREEAARAIEEAGRAVKLAQREEMKRQIKKMEQELESKRQEQWKLVRDIWTADQQNLAKPLQNATDAAYGRKGPSQAASWARQEVEPRDSGSCDRGNASRCVTTLAPTKRGDVSDHLLNCPGRPIQACLKCSHDLRMMGSFAF